MSAELEQHLPLNPRDYLILLALSQRDRHGYGLIKDVDRFTNGDVRLDPANLYRSLKKLIAAGLLAESDRLPVKEERDERRRYYALTTLGHRVVQAEAVRLEEMANLARSYQILPERRPS